MKKSQLSTVFVIVFIDMLGFGLILPLLPYYADTFGASASVIGFLVASFAAAQFIGSPLLGRLSDRYGRKPILLLSILGTSLGFLLLGFADSLLILFAGRILDGLTGGNISVVQAYISDVTDEKNRAKGLGLIGAAFGLGFIVGPATGGFLSQWGYSVPAFAAAGLAFLNFVGVGIWLPESLTIEQRAALQQRPKKFSGIAGFRQMVNRPLVGTLLYTRFAFSFAFVLFQSVFSLYALYRFDVTAQTTGYILAYVGALVITVQGGVIRRLTDHFDEHKLLVWAVALMSVSLLCWALVPNIPLLLLVMIPIALAGGTHNTVINSAMSKAVAPEEVGGILGLSSSVESLTRILAPSIGGFILHKVGTFMPGILGALVLAVFFPYVWRKLSFRSEAFTD